MRGAFLLFVAAWLVSSMARAQTTPVEPAQNQAAPSSPNADPVGESPADDSLRAALLAYEAGDWERAKQLLSEVHARQPSARTLRGLGVVAYQQNQFALAVSLLEASLVHPVKPLTPELTSGVRALLSSATQHVGRVVVEVEPPDAELEVDGGEPLRDNDGALLLEPGAHELTFRALRYESGVLPVTVSAGSVQRVRLRLSRQTPRPLAKKPVEPAHPTVFDVQEAQRSSASNKRRLHVWGYAMAGLALAAVGTAAAAAGTAWHRIDVIEQHCRAQDGCDDQEIAHEEGRAKLKMLSRLASASLIVAGAGATTSVSLFLYAHYSDRGVTNAGLSLRARF